jgi:hypothetical protein
VSAFDADALYALLPAFVRQRDQTQGGGVLRALVGVIAEQAQVVGASLDQLYDDQFIETCAPWVVPYIGDLIGFVPLRPLGPGQPAASRAEVADTIGARRRKGTLAMLEQLSSDVAGWPGMAVEFFERLVTTQYVRNHLRPGDATVDIRSPMTAVDIGGAFDLPPRTLDVRRIDTGRGRYNIPNIGLFVWRLKPYANAGHPLRAVGTNRYTFDPFGGDVPLVNPPVVAESAFGLASRANLPFFLQRYPLYAGVAPYGAAAPVAVRVDGTAVPAGAIGWCDLTSWTPPSATGINVAVDPVLGRLVFAQAPAPTAVVTAEWTYAFSGDYGGGAYERPVAPEEAALEAHLAKTVVASFAAPGNVSMASDQVIEIEDSGIYQGTISLAPGDSLLVVRAADLARPVVDGNVTIDTAAGTAVTLRGVGIGGSLSVTGTGPATVRLEHCTVRGTLDWSAPGVGGTLVLDHSLVGPVVANPGVNVAIGDSAVDAGADTAAAVSGGAGAAAGSVTVARSTILGTISARTIPLLENAIVTGTVVSAERQAGCLRYSFVPLAGSQTPRRFRCQPDLEISAEVVAASSGNVVLPAAAVAAITSAVEAWLLPAFTSRTPGQPGYLQLADAARDQIRFGAEDADEMGVFYGLFSARREANLAFRLNEYLRIGLKAGIIHAS